MPVSIRRFTIAALCTLVLAGCAAARTVPGWTTELSRNHPLIGKIWKPGVGNYATADSLLRASADADVVFLGEKHDNPDHHRLQAWIVDRLAAIGRRPAVVLEMVAEDRQDIIDRHLATGPKDARGLGPALDWDRSGWPAWRDYQPIAAAALDHGLPLMAGNLPRAVTRRVGRDGVSALPAARRSALMLDRPVSAAYRDTMLDIVAKGHCDLMPRDALAPMVAVQQVRDAVLAENMLRALDRPDTDSAVLIAGGGHARRDLGVPAHIAAMRPGLTRVAVAFVEVDDASTVPADYAGNFAADALPFDFVWFTPRANDRDYCAELRKRFSGHGKETEKKTP